LPHQKKGLARSSFYPSDANPWLKLDDKQNIKGANTFAAV